MLDKVAVADKTQVFTPGNSQITFMY